MSGKPWTPEQKAAAAVRMEARWRDPAYRLKMEKRLGAIALSEEARAAASARMTRLNEQMRTDAALKKKCVRGMTRARRDPSYRAMQALTMQETMSRPENAAKARQHACEMNRDPEIRSRQWAGKVRNGTTPMPPHRMKKTGGGAEDGRPVQNLSIRLRWTPPSGPGRPKVPRKPINYSAHGDACAAEPPIAVGQDPLLQRLKEGAR